MDIFSKFPFSFSPNASQVYILSELQEALKTNKKFIIICAPTGSGKSFVAKTICNISSEPSKEFKEDCINGRMYSFSNTPNTAFERSGCAVLTCTKSLQDQYTKEFFDGSSLKGFINYPCVINDERTFQDGICNVIDGQYKKCLRRCIDVLRGNEMGKNEPCCPYIMQRVWVDCTNTQFYNYSVFMKRNERVKMKDFIVCDEASELEGVIVNEFTCEIDVLDLVKVVKDAVPPTPLINAQRYEYLNWLRRCYEKCESSKLAIDEKWRVEFGKKPKKKKVPKDELIRHRRLYDYMMKLENVIDAWNETEFIIDRNKHVISFIPYNVDWYANNRIFKYADRVILMSATIIDHENFAKVLGINRDEYYYIEAASTFEPKKALIKKVGDNYVSYYNKERVLPLLSKIAAALCEHHKNEKGIIHTNSMEILNYVRDEMGDNSRFLYRDGNRTNEDLMNEHKMSGDNTVLVSPSMTHGIDLKGELGRFQIIMKAPFLPMNNPRVKRKMKEDPRWYVNMMLSTLVQACGRCNRSSDDESVTYILDSKAWDTIRKFQDRLPKYFLSRLVE